jgi:hypothetical protein
MKTTSVRITSKNFSYGVKTAKAVGGKFDPATKTWRIPAESPYLNAPASYSWAIVSPAADPARTWMGDTSMDAAESIF